MKFADGFWLNQRGFEVNYMNQAYQVHPIENGFLVVATPSVIYNRAMTLGGANLEIRYTSTQENCIKVSITHHKGYADNGPHFVLNEGTFKPTVEITDKQAVLISGDTKLHIFLQGQKADKRRLEIDRRCFRERLQVAGKA